MQITPKPDENFLINRQLREAEAAKIMNVSCCKLRYDRMLKQGPPYRRFGRTIRYDLPELIEWMKKQSTMVEEA